MNPNPYEPPRSYEGSANQADYQSGQASGQRGYAGAQAGYPQSGVAARVSRTPFILAAVGAWAASAYWALLTLLNAVGAAMGHGSFVQVILPMYLIVMYAIRGFQLVKGDPAAAQRIISLHVIGALATVFYIATGSGEALVIGLQSIKVVIHIFGGTTAYLARRSFERAMSGQR